MPSIVFLKGRGRAFDLAVHAGKAAQQSRFRLSSAFIERHQVLWAGGTHAALFGGGFDMVSLQLALMFARSGL